MCARINCDSVNLTAWIGDWAAPFKENFRQFSTESDSLPCRDRNFRSLVVETCNLKAHKAPGQVDQARPFQALRCLVLHVNALSIDRDDCNILPHCAVYTFNWKLFLNSLPLFLLYLEWTEKFANSSFVDSYFFILKLCKLFWIRKYFRAAAYFRAFYWRRASAHEKRKSMCARFRLLDQSLRLPLASTSLLFG